MYSLNVDMQHALRSADLAARCDTAIRGLESMSDGESAVALANDMDALLEGSTDFSALHNWRLASGLLRALAVDLAVRAAARAGRADVTTDRARLQVLLQEVDELVGELDNEQLQEELRGAYDTNAPQVNKKSLRSALAKLPLPTLYLAEKNDRWPRQFAEDGRPTTVQKIPVLRLIAFLDNSPVAATQQLRPHTLHTLRFQVRGTGWPENAQRLRIELLSTCPPPLFHFSALETGDRSGAPEFDTTLTGGIQFNATQSPGSSDLVVAVRAAFAMEDGSVREVPTVGHNQLRFRVSSSRESPAPRPAAQTPPVTAGLAPGQFEGLQNALLDAFNCQTLRRMLRTKLDTRLDHIAGNGPFADVVYDVIDWAEREGCVERLVRAARAFVPGNETLERFASEFERIGPCR
jgi:hypothetical protein